MMWMHQRICPGSDSITTYIQQVKLYFDANSISVGKQLPILLTLIGALTYDCLSELLAPATPAQNP